VRALDGINHLVVARTLYGLGLLLTPASTLSALARSPLDRPAVAVARALGARQLVQAALLRRYPTAPCLLAGAAVDAAHAASMLALARWSPCPVHRRLARRNARAAALLAVADGAGWVASLSRQ
jgi:hypothetical protein